MPTVLIVDDQLVSRMILDHLVRSIADASFRSVACITSSISRSAARSR